ncbi:sigma-54-dependent Fis family transcriptional regulator [Geothermobacter hydrogeniphilus]|uniref:Sigma-54-dependent Fis family transcriptional regulator n=1 Tax=Geothermobacter hydrogeniphilus TaxID=1969733 RepID=A0A2K2HCW3_9BACT|nr:sigma-54-dependent Fis family transcriptional regulator [Geothermobacter hydrogeniphilus]
MLRKSDGFEGIIGNSLRMQKLFSIIERVADDGESTVLIQGESGTGKELVARAVHSRSPRREKNFVPVNCAAIPDDLLESELFGYVKGAFTGATQNKMGRIQYAAGGTLFLDEIGDMKPSLQAKLLRVIQEKEFEPVGGVKPVPVNVRIVAATHRNLEQLVAEGKFREDLYYRLSVIPINIPPLRERKDDIILLLDSFTRVFNRGKRYGLKGFSERALNALVNYPWPGNVRELENLIQRLVVLHGGESVDLEDLPAKYAAHAVQPGTADRRSEEQLDNLAPIALHEALWNGDGINFNDLVDGLERQLISQALARTGGNKKEAARLLNLKRTTLIEKIKKKELETGIGLPQASCA